MKLKLNFAIFGLLIICQVQAKINLNGVTKGLTKAQSKLTGLITKNKDEITAVAEKVEDSNVNSNSDILDWVELGVGIASVIIPPPAGPIIGIASTLFFTCYKYFNTNSEVKTTTPKPIDKRDQLIEYMKKALIEVEHKLDDITQLQDSETQRAIDEITRVITKYETQKEVRTELQFINYFYTNFYKDCFLLTKHPYCASRKLIIDKLGEDNFIYDLDRFVGRYITVKTPLSITDKSFFETLLYEYKHKVKSSEGCDEFLPGKQVIFDILMYMLGTLSKMDSMKVAAGFLRLEKLRAPDRRSEFVTIAQDIVKNNARSADIIKSALQALDDTSSEIRRCDPGVNHKRDETWDKFHLLFPKFMGCVTNGVLVDDDSMHFGYERESKFLVDECEIIANSTSMQTWHERRLNPDKPFMLWGLVSSRIIGTNVKNDSLWEYHRTTHCEETIKKKNPHDADKTINKHISLCEISLENDIVKDNEVRHVSLAPVTASKGHVVTGIRWKFINRMLYLQIQQGQYINGSISTPHWKRTIEHEKNVSTMAIAKGQALGFGLADVKLADEYFVTGVQFNWTDDIMNKNKLFRIKVQGKLFKKKTEENENIPTEVWETTDWANFSKKIKIEEPDRPEFADNNVILGEHGDYVHFQQTDFTIDTAQTSIPYLDIQEVKIHPPKPLGGIGMYYKGQKGYGGFIALRAFVPEHGRIFSKKELNKFTETSNLITLQLKRKNVIKTSASEFIKTLDF